MRPDVKPGGNRVPKPIDIVAGPIDGMFLRFVCGSVQSQSLLIDYSPIFWTAFHQIYRNPENMMSQICLPLFLLAVCTVQQSYGLECYECNSFEKEACDTMDAKLLQPTTCAAGIESCLKLKQVSFIFSRFYE
ncbi:unnamed protein product [Echinostoma caproni]|uniref:Protein sleepless n=1 Tax=Echinostoma caproni TaxID=27848 RepID=A0A183B403_9TREM|nr:unnamed protein product [Echinostoma caproni]